MELLGKNLSKLNHPITREFIYFLMNSNDGKLELNGSAFVFNDFHRDSVKLRVDGNLYLIKDLYNSEIYFLNKHNKLDE